MKRAPVTSVQLTPGYYGYVNIVLNYIQLFQSANGTNINKRNFTNLPKKLNIPTHFRIMMYGIHYIFLEDAFLTEIIVITFSSPYWFRI